MNVLAQNLACVLAYRSFHTSVPWWLHLLWLTMVVWLIYRGYRRDLAERRNRNADEPEDEA